MFLKSYAESIRNGDLIIDFVSIAIWQQTETGIKLGGHGVLKVDQLGALLCDFICTSASGVCLDMFGANYPYNNEDESKNLKFEAIDINGKIWESENFALTLNIMRAATPFKCSFFLSEIVHSHQQTIQTQQENYLWFETHELSHIPKNKANSIDNTLTGKSVSRNQTDLNLQNFKVSIIKHEDHSTIYANGTFNVDDLFAALKFYIGFTSGNMPTAYALTTRTGTDVRNHIRSINKRINKTAIPQPIDDMLMLTENQWNDQYHFQLLPNILYIQEKFPKFFNSTISQWKRVWQGFNAQQSITALTLTVSIEGLLIDLFIPKLEKDKSNAEFEKEKQDLVDLLSKIEIKPSQLETLTNSINRWGNIHANAALKILEEKALITKDEVKAWTDLRNSSAHPKYSEQTIKREIKERDRLRRCLTLYYRLNLNIYGYCGAHILYEPNETMSVMFPVVDILNLDWTDMGQP